MKRELGSSVPSFPRLRADNGKTGIDQHLPPRLPVTARRAKFISPPDRNFFLGSVEITQPYPSPL
jgi:hypothetical protein